MPHGGGHHHHGGGHHHHGGGGFGHHHHHHHGVNRHHHHYRYHTGPGVFYSTGPYWYYRRRPLSWIFVSVFITIAVVVTTSVTIRYTSSSSYYTNDAKLFAPSDTRIVSVSSSLCQGVEVETGANGNEGYTATLYMLSSPPQLTGTEDFKFNEQPVFGSNRDYHFYYYYMYPGSNFTMSACLLKSSSLVTFYLFKGYGRFSNWRDDEYSYSYVKKHDINTLCSDGNLTYSYKVNSTDYYYLVFKGTYITSTPVNVTTNVHRTRYKFTNSSVVDRCSVDSTYFLQSCSVSVPLSGHTPFLEISRNPDTTEDWTDGVDVSTSCVPRIWMYVVISLCVLVGVVAFFTSLIVVCICLKKRKAKGSTTNTVTQPVSNVTEEPVAPLLANEPAPPPTNPDYNPKSGGYYGGTGEPPPAYKP